jgi:hypothetical protein
MRWARVRHDSRSRGSPIDVEDEVYQLIYGRPAGIGVPTAVVNCSADECSWMPTGASGHPSTHSGTGSSVSHHPRDVGLEDELATALLGQLDDAAREEVLSRAAAALSRLAAEPSARAASARNTSEPARVSGHARCGATWREPPRSGPAGMGLHGTHRPVSEPHPLALSIENPLLPRMPRYRVVIDRGGRGAGSRVEFSMPAPSARGAVAAQLDARNASVSAVNEAEPADRFSWSPRGSCHCTPVALAEGARGGKLGHEGRCPECGLQVLPPHDRVRGAGPVRRGAIAMRHLYAGFPRPGHRGHRRKNAGLCASGPGNQLTKSQTLTSSGQ